MTRSWRTSAWGAPAPPTRRCARRQGLPTARNLLGGCRRDGARASARTVRAFPEGSASASPLPGPAQGCADRAARRGDELARPRERDARAGCREQALRRQDGARDRPSPAHRCRRRPDRGARSRAAWPSGAPTPSSWPRAASTPASSASRPRASAGASAMRSAASASVPRGRRTGRPTDRSPRDGPLTSSPRNPRSASSLCGDLPDWAKAHFEDQSLSELRKP